MKLRVIVLGLGLIVGTVSVARGMDQATQMEYAQVFQQKVMQKYHELFFEEMVNVYVKYHEELNELKRSYAQNREKGDIVIERIKDEIILLLIPKFIPMMVAVLDEMPMMLSQEEKETFISLFSEQFIGQLPGLLEMSLKENMLIESTAYAKITKKNR